MYYPFIITHPFTAAVNVMPSGHVQYIYKNGADQLRRIFPTYQSHELRNRRQLQWFRSELYLLYFLRYLRERHPAQCASDHAATDLVEGRLPALEAAMQREYWGPPRWLTSRAYRSHIAQTCCFANYLKLSRRVQYLYTNGQINLGTTYYSEFLRRMSKDHLIQLYIKRNLSPSWVWCAWEEMPSPIIRECVERLYTQSVSSFFVRNPYRRFLHSSQLDSAQYYGQPLTALRNTTADQYSSRNL